MTSGHVFIATSLDGYIARSDGSIDWLQIPNTEDEDHGYDSFMSSVDGLVMGSGTYETVLTFGQWPYDKPVVVLSSRLAKTDVPDHLVGRVTFSNQSPRDLMQSVHELGWKRVYIDGGAVIQSFLLKGLIDDLIITRIPVLLGNGKPLFGAISADIHLRHLETKSFPSGLTQSHYEVKK